MFRAFEIIGIILVVVGVLVSVFSNPGGAGIPAINIGLFLVVGGALVEGLFRALFGHGKEKEKKKNDSPNSER
jgi:flagellar motor component MotA